MATHPSILAQEIHEQRSLGGWQATSHRFPKESDRTEQLNKNNNANSQLSMQTQLRHVGSSSLTKDRTQDSCLGSIESQPLDHQRNPGPSFQPQKYPLPSMSADNITPVLMVFIGLSPSQEQVLVLHYQACPSYVNLGKTQPPMATISSLVKIIIVATTCGRLITHQ